MKKRVDSPKKNVKKREAIQKKKTEVEKKKIKTRVLQAVVCGKFSFNNTLLSLTKTNGEVLKQVSSGSLQFRNTKKSTPYAAQKCAEEIARIANDYGVKEVEVKVKGLGVGRDVVIRRMLGDSNFSVTALMDVTPIAYGGTRPRKMPRK